MMQAPVDYPLTDTGTGRQQTAGDVTYATLLDRAEAAEPVTDEMIYRAFLNIEAAQQFPESRRAPAQSFSVIPDATIESHASHASAGPVSWWPRTGR